MMEEMRKPKSQATAIRSLLVGGLGNQLFGYFAGLHLSRHLNVDFIPHIAKRRPGETRHPFGISSFDLATPLFRESEVKFRVILLVRRLKRRLLRFFGLSQGMAERYSKLHSATQIGSDPVLLRVQRGSIIEGYFQTYKYFSSINDQVLQQLKLKNPSNWYEEKKLEIIRDNPIVIHVRRGDYADPKNHRFGVLSPEYFRRSLESASREDLNRPLWIFSDDIENVKTEFEFLKLRYANFIKAPDDSDPAESLLLMSLASTIIISNSTFSWWAATLSRGAEVVAPSKWFKDMDDPQDLIPESWIQMESLWYH